MHVWRCEAVHFGRFEDDAGSRCVWHFGRLADERVEQVDGVEVAEPVDAEVAVDAVGVFAVLVGVDAGGEDELLGEVSELLFVGRWGKRTRSRRSSRSRMPEKTSLTSFKLPRSQ